VKHRRRSVGAGTLGLSPKTDALYLSADLSRLAVEGQRGAPGFGAERFIKMGYTKQEPQGLFYSYRNACIGSTLVARWAGE